MVAAVDGAIVAAAIEVDVGADDASVPNGTLGFGVTGTVTSPGAGGRLTVVGPAT